MKVSRTRITCKYLIELNRRLTWVWIMYIFLALSDDTWAEMISSLYFSKTKQMPVKRLDFLLEHTQICASSPLTFNIRPLEHHDCEEGENWGVAGALVRLKEDTLGFADTWLATKASLVSMTPFVGKIIFETS